MSVSSRARVILVLATAISLLFAQGLRLCLHPTTHGEATAASAHVESDFTPHTETSDWSSDNQHSSLSLTLIKLAFDINFVFLVTALLLIGIAWQSTARSPLPTYFSPASRDPGLLRPPLRAPPF